jgi:hypothetical protein
MSRLVRAIPAATLAVLTVVAASTARSGAAPRTACTLVPASEASALLARPITTAERPSPISSGSSVCMYLSAGRPILQLGLSVMETEAVAQTTFKAQQQAAATHKNVGSRQKGNVVLSAIAMNGDAGMLNALLDAAAKNL